MPYPVEGPTRPRRGRLPRPRLPGAWQPQPEPGQQQGVNPGEPMQDPYDFSADPVLQRIMAMGERRRAEAQASALAARNTEEADWRDVQARLGREQVERPKALTENLNKGNLFYSSEFGTQQGNLARSLLEDAASAQRTHLGRLSDIESGQRGIEEGVEEDIASARESAAERMRERLGDLPLGGNGQGIRPARGAPATSRIAGMLGQHFGQGAARPVAQPRPTARGLAGRRPRTPRRYMP